VIAVDRTFAALADPTWRTVLERLGCGSATISEPGLERFGHVVERTTRRVKARWARRDHGDSLHGRSR
jgi:hypothetical protein